MQRFAFECSWHYGLQGHSGKGTADEERPGHSSLSAGGREEHSRSAADRNALLESQHFVALHGIDRSVFGTAQRGRPPSRRAGLRNVHE